jgi:hypothetical protein
VTLLELVCARSNFPNLPFDPGRALAYNKAALNLVTKVTNMLWFTGSGLLIAWFILKFALHKGGAIHIMLFIAISFYVIQFAQDRRTKQYKESLNK